eukprot:scaffold90043_cov25-Tisochrysis_lutea.AAC.6
MPLRVQARFPSPPPGLPSRIGLEPPLPNYLPQLRNQFEFLFSDANYHKDLHLHLLQDENGFAPLEQVRRSAQRRAQFLALTASPFLFAGRWCAHTRSSHGLLTQHAAPLRGARRSYARPSLRRLNSCSPRHCPPVGADAPHSRRRCCLLAFDHQTISPPAHLTPTPYPADADGSEGSAANSADGTPGASPGGSPGSARADSVGGGSPGSNGEARPTPPPPAALMAPPLADGLPPPAAGAGVSDGAPRRRGGRAALSGLIRRMTLLEKICTTVRHATARSGREVV